MQFEKGKDYKILFEDHAEDTLESMLFHVYGQCIKDEKSHVVIGCWVALDNPGYDLVNEKVYVIVKKAILNVKELS